MKYSKLSRVLSYALGVLLVSASFAAPAKEQIKLGFIGPLTGGNSLQGIGARNGFQLAIKQANQGDYPYEVEGVALDDESKAEVGVHAVMKLVNEPNMVGVTCCWNSPVALAIMPVIQRANLPLIVWGAISPKITDQNMPQVTRNTPTLAQENEPLANWLVKGLKYTRIAILSTTDDYGENNIKSFTKYANEAGATIVATEALPPDETNYKSVLTKIKSSNPQVVYFGGVIAPAALARKQMVDIGLNVPMAGISGIYDQKYLQISGSAADGTLATEPVVADNPRMEAFNKAYKAADFKLEQGPYAKYAYDATNILLKVIKEHGTKDKNAINKAIRNIKYDGVVGQTSFDSNGQTVTPISTNHYEVEKGKWVLIGSE